MNETKLTMDKEDTSKYFRKIKTITFDVEESTDEHPFAKALAYGPEADRETRSIFRHWDNYDTYKNKPPRPEITENIKEIIIDFTIKSQKILFSSINENRFAVVDNLIRCVSEDLVERFNNEFMLALKNLDPPTIDLVSKNYRFNSSIDHISCIQQIDVYIDQNRSSEYFIFTNYEGYLKEKLLKMEENSFHIDKTKLQIKKLPFIKCQNEGEYLIAEDAFYLDEDKLTSKQFHDVVDKNVFEDDPSLADHLGIRQEVHQYMKILVDTTKVFKLNYPEIEYNFELPLKEWLTNKFTDDELVGLKDATSGIYHDMYIEGDEVWRYSSPKAQWQALAGRGGYAIVRGSDIIAHACTHLS